MESERRKGFQKSLTCFMLGVCVLFAAWFCLFCGMGGGRVSCESKVRVPKITNRFVCAWSSVCLEFVSASAWTYGRWGGGEKVNWL